MIAAVITSNMRLAQAPGNVTLPKKASRLPHESVVNVSQVVTLDKQFFTEKVGAISLRYMKQTEAGVRLVLSL